MGRKRERSGSGGAAEKETEVWGGRERSRQTDGPYRGLDVAGKRWTDAQSDGNGGDTGADTEGRRWIGTRGRGTRLGTSGWRPWRGRREAPRKATGLLCAGAGSGGQQGARAPQDPSGNSLCPLPSPPALLLSGRGAPQSVLASLSTHRLRGTSSLSLWGMGGGCILPASALRSPWLSPDTPRLPCWAP